MAGWANLKRAVQKLVAHKADGFLAQDCVSAWLTFKKMLVSSGAPDAAINSARAGAGRC